MKLGLWGKDLNRQEALRICAPSRGLLRDCEIFANLRLKLYFKYANNFIFPSFISVVPVLPAPPSPAATIGKERNQSKQNLSSTLETWTPGGASEALLYINI